MCGQSLADVQVVVAMVGRLDQQGPTHARRLQRAHHDIGGRGGVQFRRGLARPLVWGLPIGPHMQMGIENARRGQGCTGQPCHPHPGRRC